MAINWNAARVHYGASLRQLDLFPNWSPDSTDSTPSKIRLSVDYEGLEKALLTRPDIMRTLIPTDSFEKIYGKWE